jgi:hypothetical protein
LAKLLQSEDQAHLHPGLDRRHNVEVDRTKHNAERGWNGGNATSVGRMESNLTAVDPMTQEIRKNVHLR